MVKRDVLTSKNIIRALVRGPMSHKLVEIVHRHVLLAFDDAAGHALPIINVVGGGAVFGRVKSDVCTLITDGLHDVMLTGESYVDVAMDLETTLREKMSQLSPENFEGLLHPVFEQDEWKLVLMGGVLGALIGLVQTYSLPF